MKTRRIRRDRMTARSKDWTRLNPTRASEQSDQVGGGRCCAFTQACSCSPAGGSGLFAAAQRPHAAAGPEYALSNHRVEDNDAGVSQGACDQEKIPFGCSR